MTQQEIEARQNELDQFADWLTDHDPREYMTYYHQRGVELDLDRGGAELSTGLGQVAIALQSTTIHNDL